MRSRPLALSRTAGLLIAASCQLRAILIATILAVPLAAQNVVIISVDTLRSDHLPAYGYTAIKTPNIDRLRADSVLFARAWTPYPLTLPAHASILTGLLPADHGIRDNTGYKLAAGVATLAASMKARGYATGAAVSSGILRAEKGLARGFDQYDFPAKTRDGEETAGLAWRWIEARRAPFFFLLHLYEPHAPHDPSYDAEIVRADAIVGSFLDRLRKARLYDDALIVFLSDHGEGLGDHGEREHGVFLYREALQVPLIVKFPKRRGAGRTAPADATLLDVAPTVLEVAGVPTKLPGISLAKLASAPRGSRAIFSETLYPNLQLEWNALRSVIAGDRHLVAGKRVELFDLAKDRGERKNIADAERRTVAALRAQLRTFAKPATAPSPELTSLGYLSGGRGATGDLPDPAERIVIYPDLFQLLLALRQTRYADALVRAEGILAKHPEFAEVWEQKALALSGLGRKKEALEAMKRARP
jgi:choline-sulfatase